MTNEELNNIREILLSGEEAVSPHVWEGVAKGLDKAAGAAVAGASAGRVVRFRWWGAAAAVAAVAAAVALVLLLPGRRGTTTPVHPGTVASVDAPAVSVDVTSGSVDTPSGSADTPSLASEDIPVATQISRSRVVSPSVVASAEEQGVVAPESDEDDGSGLNEVASAGDDSTVVTPSAATSTATSAGETPSTSPSATASAPAASSSSSRPDPFALLIAQMEKPEFRKPAAITVGGFTQAGGNRAPQAGPSPIYAAPVSSSVTGIREGGDEHFSMPISFAVGFRFPIIPRLSIGAGISYTMLGRSFTGTYTEAENGLLTRVVADADITEKQHYIGLPVNVYYDVVSSPRFSASVFGGGLIERCVGHSYLIPNSAGDIHYKKDPSGLQPSVVAGIGLQYNFVPAFGIYAEPGVHYYFDAHQPRSIRTMQPWMVSLELGLRYNFKH